MTKIPRYKGRNLIGLAVGVTVFFAFLLSLADINQSSAQSDESKSELHEFILVKVVPGKRDEFIAFLKDHYLILQQQDEFLKNVTYYIEDRGLEWDLIVQLVYDDYADAGRSQRRFGELLKQEYPDDEERGEFISRFQSYVDKHQHMFYRTLRDLNK